MNLKYKLSYEKGIRCGDNQYSIAIPDNFRLEKETDGRAFTAWLPDAADDWSNADIALFDGNVIDVNDEDSRIYTPEVSATLFEVQFWQTNLLMRLMSDSTKFIPLNEGYPAGGICAAYDKVSFMYHIELRFKDCIKLMRVQVMHASEEDIPECDQMVIDWVKTMIMTNPLDVVRELDDPGFVSAELTEALVEEWKSCLDIHNTIVMRTLQNRIDARYYKRVDASGEEKGTPKEMRKDDQTYVDQAAVEVSKYLISALNCLEAITKKNDGNDLLQSLYEALSPFIMHYDSVTMDKLGGVKGKVSARIPDYDEIKRRFTALMPDAEDKVEKIVPNPDFVVPTYDEKKEVLIGTVAVPVPDHMLLAAEYHSDDENTEKLLDELRNQYSLVAIPDDFEKGFAYCTEGVFCIIINKPEQFSQYDELFSDERKSELKSKLKKAVEDSMRQNGDFDARYPAEYVCGGDSFGIVLEQVDENVAPIDNWYQFTFVVFHQSNVLQGNIFINAHGERKQFVAAIKEWLSKFKVVDEKRINEEQENKIALALKECELATEKGEIDAIKVTQLFSDDVLFMNDYEVEFDGVHHKATDICFNENVIGDYIAILPSLALLVPEIHSIMDAVEEKENLIIKKNEYHKNLQEVTWNQDITGTTIFNLCAFHMLKIVKGENDHYTVAIDSNLINGIPEAYAYVAEFIRTLRDLNGMTGEFTAEMRSFTNLYGGISKCINKPIAAAAKNEDPVRITVAPGEYPYTKSEKEEPEDEIITAVEKWKADRDFWKKERARIKNERIQRAKQLEEAEKKRMTYDAVAKYNKAVRYYNSTVSEQMRLKKAAEEALLSIGAFRISEKKEQKDIIKAADKKIKAAAVSYKMAKIKYKQRCDEIDNLIANMIDSFNNTAEKELPFPQEPKINETNCKRLENEIIKVLIVEYLDLSSWKFLTVEDICEGLEDSIELSKQKCSALLRQLVVEGKVERIEDKRKAYFAISRNSK